MTARLTPAELAAECNVTRWLIYDEIKSGRLTAYRFGRRELRIRREDADAWIESCRVRRKVTVLRGRLPKEHPGELMEIARRSLR